MFITGFITLEKFILGKRIEAFANILGFMPERFAQGASVLRLSRLPQPSEFELAGYTHLSGGLPGGGKALSGLDVPKLKQMLIKEYWPSNGALVKVIPTVQQTQGESYPVGLGVPQWKLLSEVPANIVCTLKPGDVYYG